MTSKFSKKLAALATIIFVAFLHFGCSDFFHPVESTPTPTEYQYNYWLLQKTYLFEDELPGLDPDGDSVQTLYKQLQDPYTRYYPPSKSESVNISINTSFVPGDVGMEYYTNSTAKHPLFITRVYKESPAGRAGIPRYGNILKINDTELLKSPNDASGQAVRNTYDYILSVNKDVSLTIAYKSDTTVFNLTKEDIYAPTVFIDTVDDVTIISIVGFKPTTVDKENGTYGELKAYLDSTKNETKARVLNLQSNLGGHVNQCIAMADLFVSDGPLSTRTWRTFNGNGEQERRTKTVSAVSGDAGENKPFILILDRYSASCAEIFAAAVSEGAGIPVTGEKSYGKGIGQTTWQTIDKGVAIITNLEFLTPKGNSYHKKGIVPDYPCEEQSIQCAVDLAKKLYGDAAVLKKKTSKNIEIAPAWRNQDFIGGAYIEGNLYIGKKGE